MKHRHNLKKHIFSAIEDGDILLIVPPFGSIRDIALGPHILQALAEEHGYKTEILYLNMVLASILGVERYEKICSAPEFWMLGERLFARSAYSLPPLGHHPEWCADEALSISGRKPYTKMFYDPYSPFDLEVYLETEQMCQTFIDDVVDVLTSLKYKIIGGTALEGQTNCCVGLLTGIKKVCPEIITILGGANCEGDMAEGIASLSQNVDYIFSGESERNFLNFLDCYTSGKLPIHRVLPGEPLRDLDRLPLPEYKSFSHQYQYFFGEEALPKMRIGYETSRGCWWGEKQQCRFCGLYTITYREKSIEKVANEIARIKANYPENLLVMADNIMPHTFPERLLQKRKHDELPHMAYQVKSNLTSHDLMGLKEVNIQAILPGIETFSTNVLKSMQKGASGWQQLLLLRNARCFGIYVDWFMLWGLPGDTRSDYQQVLNILRLIRHLQPPRRFVHMLLMRFAPYVKNQQAFRIKDVRPWAVYDMVYPRWADRKKLANYYVGDYPCEAHEHPDIIREIAHEIAAWKHVWKTTRLIMISFAGKYAVADTRRLDGQNHKHLLDFARAKEIMTCCRYDESENQAWAVEKKLGVVVDSRYVPLVTAIPELLLEFEKTREDGGMG